MEHKSEIKFIEWSKTINNDDYDVRAVAEILKSINREHLVGLDVGGGMGRFAAAVTDHVKGCEITIIDNSKLVRPSFVDNPNCNLIESDWFTYEPDHKFDFIIFKTVLHHFVAESDRKTRSTQIMGLLKAADVLKDDGILIIQENFYESIISTLDLSSRLIYEITKISFIEKITRMLGANTAGEGVRFRNMKGWNKIFKETGFQVDSIVKKHWSWQLWQRIPLLGKKRYQAVLKLSKIK